MTAVRKVLDAVNSARMQQALTLEPQSLDDLVLISGLAKPAVTRYIKQLHAEGMVHIEAWGKDPRGYPTIRLYVWGQGVDAECPVKYKTPALRMAALRAAAKGGVL